MLVLEASALIDFLLRRPAAPRVASLITTHSYDLHAPHVLDVEVLSAVRSLAIRGELDDERAAEALDDLRNLPIERYPHGGLVSRAWELRNAISAYDAVYVGLAEALAADGATLVTADARLAGIATTFVRVELVTDA